MRGRGDRGLNPSRQVALNGSEGSTKPFKNFEERSTDLTYIKKARAVTAEKEPGREPAGRPGASPVARRGGGDSERKGASRAGG